MRLGALCGYVIWTGHSVVEMWLATGILEKGLGYRNNLNKDKDRGVSGSSKHLSQQLTPTSLPSIHPSIQCVRVCKRKNGRLCIKAVWDEQRLRSLGSPWECVTICLQMDLSLPEPTIDIAHREPEVSMLKNQRQPGEMKSGGCGSHKSSLEFLVCFTIAGWLGSKLFDLLKAYFLLRIMEVINSCHIRLTPEVTSGTWLSLSNCWLSFGVPAFNVLSPFSAFMPRPWL